MISQSKHPLAILGTVQWTHQRAWYPLVNLWMVMAALRMRRYFLRANQQRMVFWMRMQAARSLSALSFSR